MSSSVACIIYNRMVHSMHSAGGLRMHPLPNHLPKAFVSMVSTLQAANFILSVNCYVCPLWEWYVKFISSAMVVLWTQVWCISHSVFHILNFIVRKQKSLGWRLSLKYMSPSMSVPQCISGYWILQSHIWTTNMSSSRYPLISMISFWLPCGQ